MSYETDNTQRAESGDDMQMTRETEGGERRADEERERERETRADGKRKSRGAG